jgi:hypothetical protein
MPRPARKHKPPSKSEDARESGPLVSEPRSDAHPVGPPRAAGTYLATREDTSSRPGEPPEATKERRATDTGPSPFPLARQTTRNRFRKVLAGGGLDL